jgi:hypothetical protein
MPAITLATAQARLDAYLAAELAVLSGQAYQIGNRSFKRADLKLIQDGITEMNARVIRLTAMPSGGIRLRGATPAG